MRIGYVTHRYAPHVGGVETHVGELARRGAAAGHDVEVLTVAGARREAGVEELDGVTVRRFPQSCPSSYYSVSLALGAYLRRMPPFDLLHVLGYHTISSLQATCPGGPMVFTPLYHGTGHSPLRALLHHPYRVAGRRIFRRAQQVICVTEGEACLVRAHFPWVAPKLHVISNGVDVSSLRAAEPFPASAAVRRVVSIGRLEDYKNVDVLIDAMAELPADMHLVVVGGGPAEGRLRQRAERLGLGGRVEVLGQVDAAAVPRWYASADAFVTLSSQESQSIVLLEAVASGCPAVASDIAAHRDVAEGSGAAVAFVALPAAASRVAVAIAEAFTRPRIPAGVLGWDDVVAATFERYRVAISGRQYHAPAGSNP
jgi:glycosyltransferase involved in cell wall biosynthesis